MAEDTPTPTSAGTDREGAPSLNILAQYVKDLSFENPNALARPPEGEEPKIDIQVNVGARNLTEADYEVTLQFSAKATRGAHVDFVAELVYAGVFRLHNVPEAESRPVLLIEAPRQIFPFARRILADATRDGGFPPLMIDPINFAELYQNNPAPSVAENGAGSPDA